MQEYIIEGHKYYITSDIKSEHSLLWRGCRTPADFLKKHEIPETSFSYARDKDDAWIKSDGTSRKFDKLFIRKSWFNKHLANYADECPVDDVQDAPPIIELEDYEKFYDSDGNILDIEVRGERNCDECFFKVADVSRCFGIDRLHQSIINKGSHKKDIHYVYFYLDRNINNEGVKIKKLFLTYHGILKVLFSSRNGKTDKFVKWVSKTLFAVQMGSSEQKTDLAGTLLGVDSKTIKQVFSKTSRKIPCVYLFSVGTVKDLRKKMKLDKRYRDDDIIYKYGLTTDIERRSGEHHNTYTKLGSRGIELIYFSYIDPQYLSEAETTLSDFFDSVDMKVEHDKMVELVMIPQKKMKIIKKQYEMLSGLYMGSVSELIFKLKEKDHEMMMLREKTEKDIMKMKHEMELNKEKFEKELLKKDLEIAKLQSACKK